MSDLQKVSLDFAKYILESGKLPELQKLTQEIDEDIRNSHNFLEEVRKLPSVTETVDDIARHEQITKFLEAGPPRLLLPDMEHFYDLEMDVDQNLNMLKTQLEMIQKNIVKPSPHLSNIKNIDCSISSHFNLHAVLEQISKRLGSIKTLIVSSTDDRVEVEEKLQLFCSDVESFTKMIQAVTKIAQTNETTVHEQLESSNSLCFDDLVQKLLGNIKEVLLLLQNKN